MKENILEPETSETSGKNAAFLTVLEQKIIRLSKNTRKCETYSAQDFIECSKANFLKKNLDSINCTIFNMKEFMDPADTPLPLCKNESTAAETFNTLKERLSETSEPYSIKGCAVPCTQISYNYKLEYYNIKSWYQTMNANNEGTFLLHFLYRRLDTEEQTETIIYDIGSFLTAAGGNLGLFMGFSCLSIILTAIEYIAASLPKIK